MTNLDKPDRRTPQPLAIALETSSRTGSVALGQGPTLWDEEAFSAPMRHAAEVIPTLSRLLQDRGRRPADVDHVYLAIGPGSFTGLRIAVTLAKMMHLASGVRIVAVDSLDVLAANVVDSTQPMGDPPDRIVALFDAKRGQFYAAVYDRSTAPCDPASGYRIPAPDGAWRKTVPDCLMTRDEIVRAGEGASRFALLGDGLVHHQDAFAAAGIPMLPASCWSPRAAKVYALAAQKAAQGRFEDPIALTPFYLRGAHVTLRARA